MLGKIEISFKISSMNTNLLVTSGLIFHKINFGFKRKSLVLFSFFQGGSFTPLIDRVTCISRQLVVVGASSKKKKKNAHHLLHFLNASAEAKSFVGEFCLEFKATGVFLWGTDVSCLLTLLPVSASALFHHQPTTSVSFLSFYWGGSEQVRQANYSWALAIKHLLILSVPCGYVIVYFY